MHRSGLLIAALAGVACSIPNPFFEVREDGSSAGTEGQMTTSEGSVSTGGPTSGPDTGTSEPTGTGTGAMGVCGDAKVDPGETCDDGNAVGGDGCPANCVSERCGDGATDLRDGEECDDANAVDDDECTNACRLPACGDGVVQGDEGCDDGDLDDTDSCPTSCQPATCGDGFVNAREESCDDGVDNGGYGLCNLDCTHVRECGDGILDMEEGCDDGNDVEGDGCDSCVLATCGNNVVDPGEPCDDGNGNEDDECTSKCQLPACGDGFKQPLNKEECDDGNAVSTDDCTGVCKKAACGDGFVWDSQEMCDDGNVVNTDSCLASCIPASCGDSYIQAGVEECDDGDNDPNDGCSPFCAVEPDLEKCGNGQIDGEEECDTELPLFKGLPGLCTDGCKIEACFKVHNDKQSPQEELALQSIEWLTPCVSDPGGSVFVMLVDDDKNVVYAAKGSKGVAVWETDNITFGSVKPGSEYDVKLHERTVKLTRLVPSDGKFDVLMLTSQVALQKNAPECFTSLGDGYGVAIFPDLKPQQSPRMLVMPAIGPNTNTLRAILGFKGSTEISFVDANATMGVCMGGVTGFSGTFYMSVL